MVTAEYAQEQTRRNKNWMEIRSIYKCALKNDDTMASDEKDDRFHIAAFFKGCGGRPAVFVLYKDKYQVKPI